MRTKFYTALVLMSLGLTACNSGGGGSQGAPTPAADPNSGLLQKETASSTPLTDVQVAELTKTNQLFAKLPSEQLIFQRENEGETERAMRKQKFEAMDDDGRANLLLIQKKCTIQNPKRTSDLRGIPTVGTAINENEVAGVEGRNCPISFSSQEDNKTVYNSLDLKSGNYSIDMNFSKKTVEKVLTESLQSTTDLVTMEVINTGKGTMSQTDGISKSRMDVHAQMDAKTKSGKTLRMNVILKSVENSTAEKITLKQTSLVMRVRYPQFEVVLVGFKEVKEGTESASYNLNGKELSLEQVKDIFGPSFSMN